MRIIRLIFVWSDVTGYSPVAVPARRRASEAPGPVSFSRLMEDGP